MQFFYCQFEFFKMADCSPTIFDQSKISIQLKVLYCLIFSTSDRIYQMCYCCRKLVKLVIFIEFVEGRERPWEAVGGRGRPWEAVRP